MGLIQNLSIPVDMILTLQEEPREFEVILSLSLIHSLSQIDTDKLVLLITRCHVFKLSSLPNIFVFFFLRDEFSFTSMINGLAPLMIDIYKANLTDCLTSDAELRRQYIG